MNPQPRILVMGAGSHRRHRRGDADRGRLRRHRGVDQRRDPRRGRQGRATASSTTARSARSAAGCRPRPRARYDLCVLATQPPNVEDAARTALPHLADDAQVVVLQNGLCEERIAAIVGADARDRRDRRVGRVDARARALRAHRGRRLPDRPARRAAIDADLRRVGELLEAIGPVTMTREPARRALEQARAQLRGVGARHDRGRAARPARARAALSPARARDHDRGGRGRARRGRRSSRRSPARSTSSGSR